MKVQILGTGCKKCETLYQHARQAVSDAGVDAELEKITDLSQIMAFGVMNTPALAVDGQVKTSGKIPSVDDIKQMIQ